MNILIISDDKSSNRILEKGLSDLHHYVISVSDAFEGVSFLTKTNIELVFCDIQAPTISRISIPSLVEEFVKHRIPLVLLSSVKEVDLLEKSARLGAVEFLLKPLNLDKIVSIIDRYH